MSTNISYLYNLVKYQNTQTTKQILHFIPLSHRQNNFKLRTTRWAHWDTMGDHTVN